MGFEVTDAADGDLAAAAVDAGHFDIVVSDWMMPGKSGVELCAHVRGQQGRPYAFIILITARGGKESFLEGMAAGADDYLTKPIDKDELAARMMAARRVVEVHRALADKQAKLEEAYVAIESVARVDTLTSVGNRRALDEQLVRVQDEVDRYSRRWAIALCDLDCFKLYNDTYGHQAGDDVLKQVGQCFRSQCRSGDRVYRYGGEEFVVLLPEQDVERATRAINRVREAICALGIEHQHGPAGVVSLSAGIAVFTHSDVRSTRDSVEQADRGLYAAKHQGRNRVCSVDDAVDDVFTEPSA